MPGHFKRRLTQIGGRIGPVLRICLIPGRLRRQAGLPMRKDDAQGLWGIACALFPSILARMRQTSGDGN